MCYFNGGYAKPGLEGERLRNIDLITEDFDSYVYIFRGIPQNLFTHFF